MQRFKHLNAVPLVICVLALLGAQGCQKKMDEHAAAPGNSNVRIVSLSPDLTQSLRAGDQIKLQVVAEYTLDADSGTVSLVVQGSDDSSIASETEVVSRGTGKVNLQAQFSVPRTNTIQVFVPLQAQGQNRTSTVDMRAYKVVPG